MQYLQKKEGQVWWNSTGLCLLQNIWIALQVWRHRATQEKAQPVCWPIFVQSNELNISDSEEYLQELEQRIRSLQDELNEAHASKRRRIPSDDGTGPEHVQPSDASDSELPSPRDDTIQVPFEAEADRSDGDGGSYTLKTPKGAMRFFGEYWLTDFRFSMVVRMVELILPTPRCILPVFDCFPWGCGLAWKQDGE